MNAGQRILHGVGLVLLVIWYVTLAYTIPGILTQVYATTADVTVLLYFAGIAWAAWGITSAWLRIEAKKQGG